MTYIAKLTGRKATSISQTMMMLLAGVVLVILQSSTVQAQWTTTGTNISNSNSGNVGIGTSTPASSLHVATESTVVPRGITNSQHSADGNGGLFVFRKSRGTIASPAMAVNGDSIGNLYAEGYDGGSYISGGRIRFLIDGPVSTGVIPTSVQFFSGSGGFGGIERMRINSSGNVGIGTPSPVFDANVARYLTVDGGAGVIGSIGAAGGTGNAGTAVSQVAFINSNLGTTDKRLATIIGSTDGATNSGVLDFYTASAGAFSIPRLRINSGGNIGIGTSTPGYRLDVQGGALNSSGGLCIAGDCKTAWSQVGGGGTSQWTTGIGATIYYNMGYVGIGTASPTAQLHIAGANGLANNTAAPAPDALQVVGGIGGNGTWGASQGGVGGGVSFAGGTGGTPVAGSQAALGGKGGSINLVGGGGGPNVFSVGGGAGGDVSINGGAGVANSDGNIFLANLRGKVGIGTASPNAVLEVRKEQNASTDIYLNNATAGSGTGAYTGLRFYEGTTLKAFVGSANSGASGYNGGANALQIWNMQNAPMVFGTNGLERMRIDAAGNVGIGTTPNSNYKLDVNGNTNVTGNLNVTGNINAKYQDMAEWVESSQVLTAGTVVVLDQTKSNQVVASTEAYDTRVAGVISLQPGITLGEKTDTKVLVATTGRVKIKVDATSAPIHVGDLLVTSDIAGVAKKSEPLNLGGVQIHRPGTLIGKALEPLEKGAGEILVLLSLQ